MFSTKPENKVEFSAVEQKELESINGGIIGGTTPGGVPTRPPVVMVNQFYRRQVEG